MSIYINFMFIKFITYTYLKIYMYLHYINLYL